MIVYIKSKEEIEGFKKVGKISALIMEEILSKISPGITTSFLDSFARDLCKKHNVEPTFLGYREFPAAICASINNVMVHGIPNDIVLNEGDLLTIDIGISNNGYIGDTAETLCVGMSDSELILSCREALAEGIKQAKSGNKLSDISKVIFKVAKHKFQIPNFYGGHGIDRGILHSAPFVSNVPDYNSDMMLRDGMIFAIEPMFIDSVSNKTYVDKDGWSVISEGISAHCEHTILISGNEPTVLTRRN